MWSKREKRKRRKNKGVFGSDQSNFKGIVPCKFDDHSEWRPQFFFCFLSPCLLLSKAWSCLYVCQGNDLHFFHALWIHAVISSLMGWSLMLIQSHPVQFVQCSEGKNHGAMACTVIMQALGWISLYALFCFLSLPVTPKYISYYRKWITALGWLYTRQTR